MQKQIFMFLNHGLISFHVSPTEGHSLICLDTSKSPWPLGHARAFNSLQRDTNHADDIPILPSRCAAVRYENIVVIVVIIVIVIVIVVIVIVVIVIVVFLFRTRCSEAQLAAASDAQKQKRQQLQQ